MKHATKQVMAAALAAAAGAAHAQVIINEVMQDPPGGGQSNWEFIELYGRPGMDLTGYAVGLFKGGADDGDGIPETIPEIDEAFTLDGLSLGADGFLVLVNSPAGEAAQSTAANATLSNFAAQHIPTSDTAGSLANGDSTTYLLVRARPNHTIQNGVSVYSAGYAFRKEPNPDVDFDGKIDFGIEGGGAFQIDPLQIVDGFAWSNSGGKEYVRSSEQEISDTPGFDPDAASRVNYFLDNPMLGNRVNGSNEVVSTRMADESWVYGEIARLPSALGELPEYGPAGEVKAPTDPAGPLYTCPPTPADETACSVNAGGQFRFDDLAVVNNAGLPNEEGFQMTPGTFNDDARFGITQFRFVTADFDFDGDADSDDLALIQAQLGSTLDDRVDCLDDMGSPIIDPSTALPFQCYVFEGRAFNAIEAMRSMDSADGPGGTNADAVTMADIAAADALIEDDRFCGDVNMDGAVTDSDFFAWVTAFLTDPQTPESLIACDVNADGNCNDSDFFAWVTAFIEGENGPRCSP